MLRFIVRVAAMLVLAAGFAALVIDGTRSIAGGELSLTPFSDLLKSRLPGLEQAIGKNIHPLLWDPVATSLLRLPAWLVLALLGLLLLRVARRRVPAPGALARN